MTNTKISQGTVHTVPQDLRKILVANTTVKSVWKDITPLARNEWICWIISAKKTETRTRRLRILCENLAKGKRRPCCFAGCIHRKDK